MSEPKRYRNTTTRFTPAQRKQYKTEAAKVDREEQQAILAQARRVKARVDMLRQVLGELKAERQRQGLSLTDLSRRSGIDKAALSRLENAANANPKLDTLVRYAEAIGIELRVTVAGNAA
ncbi:MAG: helix-turn-helix transcriptional regulator [Phycisphaeraceae bacterium]|nr:helix-turn-helix transcriptional regulator [Phycisphaeraceae bacterium]